MLFGLLIHELAATALRNTAIVAAATIVFGLLLWYADHRGSRTRDENHFAHERCNDHRLRSGTGASAGDVPIGDHDYRCSFLRVNPSSRGTILVSIIGPRNFDGRGLRSDQITGYRYAGELGWVVHGHGRCRLQALTRVSIFS